METKESNFTIETAGTPTTTEIEVKTETPKEEVKTEVKEEGTKEQPRKGRAQKRIESLSADKRELSKEVEELKARLQPQEPEAPDIDNFDDYDDFKEAEKTYKEDAKTFDENKEAVTPIDHDFNTVLDEIETKFDDARDVYQDFDEVVKKAPNEGGASITRDMVLAMNDIDNSGEVAYSLGKDVKESIRISNLSPTKQVIEIVKLSEKLKTGKKPTIETTKRTTNATEPIVPTGGAGGVGQKTLGDAGSFDDYSKMRIEETANDGGW